MKLTAGILIRSICAVLLSVAEKPALDAVAITAREESVLAERLVGHQKRLHLALLVLELAVLDGLLPVARLLLDVEEETGWTADGLQALKGFCKKKFQQTNSFDSTTFHI